MSLLLNTHKLSDWTVSRPFQRMFQVRGPMMVKKVYEPVMISNQLFAKDIALIGDAVNKTGVYTPLFREAAALYGLVNECERLRHEDSASVHSFLEQKSSP